MRLPDAEGFVKAVEESLRDGLDVLYIHDEDGDMIAAVLPIDVYNEKVEWDDFPNHDHVEPSLQDDEIPWMVDELLREVRSDGTILGKTVPRAQGNPIPKVSKPFEYYNDNMPDDDFPVLGTCPHGVDLDKDFCPQGCRV